MSSGIGHTIANASKRIQLPVALRALITALAKGPESEIENEKKDEAAGRDREVGLVSGLGDVVAVALRTEALQLVIISWIACRL